MSEEGQQVNEQPANCPDIVLQLPHCTLRIPAYVPTVTRIYSCPVEGGRYVLKWDKTGRLISLIFHPKPAQPISQRVQKVKTPPRALPRRAIVREEGQTERRGRMERRGRVVRRRPMDKPADSRKLAKMIIEGLAQRIEEMNRARDRRLNNSSS